MKTVLIVGLGRFGRHIAEKLSELGHELMVVDKNEARVEAVASFVTNAQIGDSMDENFLRSLGIGNFDECIVAIGDDFQSSLETTSLLKELGAKHVISRASREVHAKFLLRNGADEVVYPEHQVAEWTAIRCGSDRIFDYFALSGEYAIYELAVPPEWIGKTLSQLDVRRKHGINVLAVKHSGILSVTITPETTFTADETILVLGKNKDVFKHFHIS